VQRLAKTVRTAISSPLTWMIITGLLSFGAGLATGQSEDICWKSEVDLSDVLSLIVTLALAVFIHNVAQRIQSRNKYALEHLTGMIQSIETDANALQRTMGDTVKAPLDQPSCIVWLNGHRSVSNLLRRFSDEAVAWGYPNVDVKAAEMIWTEYKITTTAGKRGAAAFPADDFQLAAVDAASAASIMERFLGTVASWRRSLLT